MEIDTLTSPQTSLELLLVDIHQCLTQLWGEDLRITQYQPLSERISCVGRLFIEGKSAFQKTVIAKHIPFCHYPAENKKQLSQEFIEEHVCYQFLHSQQEHYSLFAQQYAFDEQGFILLQDLETEIENIQEDVDVLADQIAYSLASLHLATFGKNQSYQALRQQAGLPTFENDQRAYSLAAHRRRYRLGASTLKDYADIMGVTTPDTWQTYIDLIEADIENPGAFHCFLHDDLANARQVIKHNNQFYLIDFENAKFSHALLDLCKPLAGKFEMLIDSGEFFYSNPNFPINFIDSYRRNLFTLGNKNFDQAQWESAFTHTLIYHCLGLVGKLVEISADRKLRKSFAFDLCTIISRHVFLLESFSHYTQISHVLTQLKDRVYRPEFSNIT